MLGTVVLAIFLKLLGWDYWVIAVEAALIGLFALFWLIQTIELWHAGLREPA